MDGTIAETKNSLAVNHIRNFIACDHIEEYQSWLTGVEAMFADLGHFSQLSIKVSKCL